MSDVRVSAWSQLRNTYWPSTWLAAILALVATALFNAGKGAPA